VIKWLILGKISLLLLTKELLSVIFGAVIVVLLKYRGF
jgi:hypothetical protein